MTSKPTLITAALLVGVLSAVGLMLLRKDDRAPPSSLTATSTVPQETAAMRPEAGRSDVAGDRVPGRVTVASSEVAGGGDARPAWIAHGQVIDETKRPIPGARLQVITALAQDPMAERVADDAGRFELSLAKPASASEIVASALRPYVRAEAPGFSRGGTSIDRWREPVELVITLRREDQSRVGRDARIAGRVVDVNGAPVAGAWLTARAAAASAGSARSERQQAPRSRTRADGTYWIAIAEPGAYSVHAAAFDAGVALRPDVTVSAGESVELPDLVLRGGPATICGSVAYPDGRPAKRVEVVASAEASPSIDTGLILSGSRDEGTIAAPADVVGLAGMPAGYARTNEQGVFTMTALLPGTYRMTLPRADPELVELAEAGGQDVHLILRRRKLHVTIVDEQGTVMPDMVGHAVLGDGTVHMTSFRNGKHTYDVTPGKVQISVRAPASRPALVQADIGQGDWDTSVDVVLHPLGATGSLRLLMKDERGQPLDHGVAQLTTPAAPTFLDAHQLRDGSAGYDLPCEPPFAVDGVAAGHYRLHVLPGATSTHDVDPAFVQERLEVDIAEGRETSIEVNARRGGRLAIMLNRPVPKPQPTTAGDRPRTLSGREPDLSRISADVRLIRLGEPEVEISTGGFVAEGQTFPSALVAGRRATSAKPIAPGNYRVRITAHGSAPVERLVDIAADETALIEVDVPSP